MPRFLYPLQGSPLLTSCTVSACGACWRCTLWCCAQGVVCLLCYVHCACIARGKRQHGGVYSSGNFVGPVAALLQPLWRRLLCIVPCVQPAIFKLSAGA